MTDRDTAPVLAANDALPLEHKLVNGRARRNLDLSEVVNNPAGSGFVWISGYLLETLQDADEARDEVIRVDAFSRDKALRP